MTDPLEIKPVVPESAASIAQVFGPSSAPVAWDSQAILRGQREVFIQHGSECYRLILTKSGKLILQK